MHIKYLAQVKLKKSTFLNKYKKIQENTSRCNYELNIQWKPLNVITLGQTETDNINRLITLTDDHFSAQNHESINSKKTITAIEKTGNHQTLFLMKLTY